VYLTRTTAADARHSSPKANAKTLIRAFVPVDGGRAVRLVMLILDTVGMIHTFQAGGARQRSTAEDGIGTYWAAP
jgi:hypothetical protein